MSGPFRSSKFASRVAYHMAPVDLERAVHLAERHDFTGYSDGMIALALADLDPDGARAALELAFQRAEDPDTPAPMFDKTKVLAALLDVANRVDPEHYSAWAARALDYRFEDDPRMQMRVLHHAAREAALAAFIADRDPVLARGLLHAALEPLRGETDVEQWGTSSELFSAAACVDPELALEHARLAGEESVQRVAAMLARTPEQRREFLVDRILKLWTVGKEDL